MGCGYGAPGLAFKPRLGVETPVVEPRSSSDSGSKTFALLGGFAWAGFLELIPTSFNHGSVLPIVVVDGRGRVS